MLNTYTPPIAVALGCVASKLSPHEAARLTVRNIAKDQSRGLGFADIALASMHATKANHLQVRRALRGDLIRR